VLPFVDERMRPVAASVEATWEAVHAAMTSPPSRRTERYARLVGARDGRPFAVAEADPPHRLVLVGEHRFSRYSLVFTVDELDPPTRFSGLSNFKQIFSNDAIISTTESVYHTLRVAMNG